MPRYFSLLFLISVFYAPQGWSFSIEEIIAQPYVSGLVANSQGTRFAWVREAAGVRNIWGVDSNNNKTQQLTHYKMDTGVNITLFGFTAEGTSLLYSRGSSANAANFSSGIPGYTSYALVWPETGSKNKPQAIGNMSSLSISPTANEVAYIQDNAIWSLSLSTLQARQEATARGTLQVPIYSPDGRSWLFQTQRRSEGWSYAFIAMYQRDSKTIKYLDASVYSDYSPLWSPDGKKVAFLRQFTEGQNILTARGEYPKTDPWAIVLYDFDSDKAKQLWRSENMGTTYGIELAWLNNNKLIFTREKGFHKKFNGKNHRVWRHIYSIDTSGKHLKQLTDGEFEVEAIYPMPNKNRVAYVSNRLDIDRRDISVVDEKGESRRLSLPGGISFSPALPIQGDHFAYLRSTETRSIEPFLGQWSTTAKARSVAAPRKVGVPANKLIAPEKVVFNSLDGWPIHGQWFEAPKKFEGKRPTLIYLHGGPDHQMLLGWHPMRTFSLNYGMNQYFTSVGYNVLSINFRMGTGYGREFRDVNDSGPRGASEYKDILAAARFLRQNDRVDSERLGLWGVSYGGTLTGLGLARNSDLFSAGVEYFGMQSWNQWQSWRERKPGDWVWYEWQAWRGRQTPNYYHNALAWQSSSESSLPTYTSPVLFLLGDDDQSVPFSQTLFFYRKMKEAGLPAHVRVYPDEIHSFLMYKHWVSSFTEAVNFFGKHLK